MPKLKNQEEIVERIVSMKADGVSVREIAEALGVSRGFIFSTLKTGGGAKGTGRSRIVLRAKRAEETPREDGEEDAEEAQDTDTDPEAEQDDQSTGPEGTGSEVHQVPPEMIEGWRDFNEEIVVPHDKEAIWRAYRAGWEAGAKQGQAEGPPAGQATSKVMRWVL